jgi:hypothetical protein
MPRRVAIFLLVSLLLTSALAFGQIRNPFPNRAEASQLVREFCRLDYLGGRLSASSWARMKPLTTWTENPAWRVFRVVSRFDVTSDSGSVHSANVTVRYLPLGTFELGIGYTASSETDEVVFNVKSVDDEWRIDSTDPGPLVPQVSKSVAVQWLQGKLKTVTDPADKLSIETALKQLQVKP